MQAEGLVSQEILEPFPGLRPFSPEESDLFFGREGQCDDLAEKMGKSRFVAVVGASGSGKSSLVWAGLLPSLEEGRLFEAGSEWRFVGMRPGACPIDNLASSLSEAITGASVSPDVLRESSLALHEFARRAYQEKKLGPKENLLILVDQFEELFRYKTREDGNHELEETMEDRDEKSAFVKLLLEATRQKEVRLYVIITMRSDFLGDCARFRDLPEAINSGQYLLPRMTRDQRRKAIEGPIRMAGREITPRLVQRILNETGEDPDQLPVMQHALMRTWHYWSSQNCPDRPIDIPDYEAIGTLQDALSNDAEEALLQASKKVPERGEEIVKRVFQLLRETDPSGREIRRPTPLSELCAVTETTEEVMLAVLEGFRQRERSFFSPPPKVDIRGGGSIDITHEALLRKWKRLLGPPTKDTGWLADEAESKRTLMRLADRADQAGGTDYLHGPFLHVARDWWDRRKPNEAWAVRYIANFKAVEAYLNASEKNHTLMIEREEQKKREEEQARLSLERDQRDKQRKSRRMVIIAASSVAGVFLALSFAGYSWKQRAKIAVTNRDLSDSLKKQAALSDNQKRLIAEIKDRNNELGATVFELGVKEKELMNATKAAEASAAEADNQRRIAVAASASSGALLHLIDQPELGFLLAVEASREGDTPETSSALLHAIETVPNLRTIVHTAISPIADMAFHDRTLVSIDSTGAAAAYSDQGVPLSAPASPASPSLKSKLNASLNLQGFALQLESISLPLPVHVAFIVPFRLQVPELSALGATITETDWPTPARRLITDVPFAFNGDGQVMALRWPSNGISLWHIADKKRVDVKLDAGKKVTSMALSRDGHTLALAREDATIAIWDIHDPANPIAGKTLKLTTLDAVSLLEFDAKARFLASSVKSSPPITIWDLTQVNPVPRSITQDGVPTSLAFNEDGTILASGSKSGYVGVWSAPLGRFMWSERVHNASVTTVVFSGDGKTLASNAKDQIALWNVAQQNLSQNLPDRPPLTGTPSLLSFTPDHHVTVVGLHTDPATPGGDAETRKLFVRTWSASDPRRPDPKMGSKTSANPMALSPNGLMVASVKQVQPQVNSGNSCPKGELLFTSTSGADLAEKTLLNDQNITAVAFSPDSRELLVGTCQVATTVGSGAPKYEVLLYDVTGSPRLEHTLSMDSRVSAIAVTADRKMLAASTFAANSPAKIVVWDLDEKKPRTLDSRENLISTLLFSPDGKKLVSAVRDGAIALWDVSRGQQLERFPNASSLGDLTFSPDGHILASSTEFGQIFLWDVQALRVLGVLPTPSGYDSFSIFLRRYRPATANAVELAPNNPLAFDPRDGGKLASATGDLVTLWEINPAEWKKLACRYANRNLTYAEWQQYGQKTYQKTCKEFPIHPSVMDAARELVVQGDKEKALAIFLRVKELEPNAITNPKLEVEKTEALNTGVRFLRTDPFVALKAYERVLSIDPSTSIPATTWNSICWYGSLQGHAAQVMSACQRATAMEPKNVGFLDSRGVARALTGNIAGAISDFQAFAQSDLQPSELRAQRVSWIKALQSDGPSPFTDALLKSLLVSD